MEQMMYTADDVAAMLQVSKPKTRPCKSLQTYLQNKAVSSKPQGNSVI